MDSKRRTRSTGDGEVLPRILGAVEAATKQRLVVIIKASGFLTVSRQVAYPRKD